MRIFRKIRKKLLVSGKIKNYLIYALGEIILIVLGVLIAWKINTLNELRKNKIVEIKIYQSLNEELNANLDLLDYAIASYTQNVQNLESTIDLILEETPKLLSEDEKKAIIDVAYKPTQLHSGAINSVNTTNKFEFIESVFLKDLIAAYPNELDNFQNQETKIENIIVNRLQPTIEKYISLIDILTQREFPCQEHKEFTLASNYNNLLLSRSYQNCLVDRVLQTEIQLENAKTLRDKTQMIAYKLTKELENE
ncbi:hypothetical protein [Winogradskyella arenosi]|uniref:Uncharacterized protein n=1 Tax=Winogradskyella arenosi TaxID=533325 RepID=A0A368ZDW4_9FLAO|nr:hypothetical protein [Winogradskyella arenosi]RCW91432.1 hypothetical protein DFQ08_103262 [Winogradskyella arenosi]